MIIQRSSVRLRRYIYVNIKHTQREKYDIKAHHKHGIRAIFHFVKAFCDSFDGHHLHDLLLCFYYTVSDAKFHPTVFGKKSNFSVTFCFFSVLTPCETHSVRIFILSEATFNGRLHYHDGFIKRPYTRACI